jgi:hypothetical protein
VGITRIPLEIVAQARLSYGYMMGTERRRAMETAGGDELVLIASFAYAPEAKFVRAQLEAENIPCFLGNERTLDIDWFLVNLLDGYKIYVPAADAERALEILNSRVSDEDLEAQAAAAAAEPHD